MHYNSGMKRRGFQPVCGDNFFYQCSDNISLSNNNLKKNKIFSLLLMIS